MHFFGHRISKNLGLLEIAYVTYIDVPRWLIDYDYFNHAHMLKKGRDGVRKMDIRPIYFGFWCLMTNTTKLD